MLGKCFGVHCLIQQFSVATVAVSVPLLSMGASNVLAAQANANLFTVDIQIPGQLIYTSVIQQAEFLARAEITKQFSLDPDLNEVQVVVLGHYVGDIVPILIVNVSREQWQSSPQVDRWGSYYSSTYALLNRHDEAESSGDRWTARSSEVTRGANSRSQSQAFDDNEADARVQVESAFRNGLLTRDEYQQSVDALD